jgi:LmbE family N-acetylglucosaminyl deacetylase
MTDIFNNKRIMIVVAHPDDELLGLGATMHKLILERNIVTNVLILGEGITSRSDTRDLVLWQEALVKHMADVEKARLAIGYHKVSTHNLPDNRFDTVPLLDIIKTIEKEKKEFDADIIFTHHGGDLNIDHRKTFEAVITACRPLSNEKVKAIFTFETPSGTEWRASTDPHHFIPNFFVPVSEANLNAKISAMEAYEYERRVFPHPRSPEALKIQAQRWGVSIGQKYAEAFSIVRGICV